MPEEAVKAPVPAGESDAVGMTVQPVVGAPRAAVASVKPVAVAVAAPVTGMTPYVMHGAVPGTPDTPPATSCGDEQNLPLFAGTTEPLSTPTAVVWVSVAAHWADGMPLPVMVAYGNQSQRRR